MTTKQKKRLRRKWKRWIDTITLDLANLLISNDIFKEIRRIVSQNKQIQSPGLIHSWIGKNYVDSITVGIRRLNDHDKRSISLYRLVEDISDNREAITREFYISRYHKHMREEGFADRNFDNFANKGENLISLYKLNKDMSRLERDTKRIRMYVSKRVAHCDLYRKRLRAAKYGDVDKALKDVDILCCKYYMLITRGGMATIKPVIGYDWRKPLRYPWIAKESKNNK